LAGAESKELVLSEFYGWMLNNLAERAAEAHAAERALAARTATRPTMPIRSSPLTPDQSVLLDAIRTAAAPATTVARSALIRHLVTAGWFRDTELRPAEPQGNAGSAAFPAEHPATRAGQTRLHRRLEALRQRGAIDFDRDAVRVPGGAC
jgi:hypothetical protein